MRRLREAGRSLVLVSLGICLAAAQNGSGGVHLTPVQGAGPNELSNGQAQRVQVRLLDGSNRPIQGVAVLFQAPDSAPTVVFPDGASSAIATTDFNGYATAPPTAPKGEGAVIIRVSAGYRGDVVSMTVEQRNINTAPPVRPSTPSAVPASRKLNTSPGVATVRPNANSCDPASKELHLEIAKDKGISHDADSRAPFQATVQVSRSCRPVAGAVITFTLPAEGPGGFFEGNSISYPAVTGDDGSARSGGIMANGLTGEWQLVVSATSQGETVTRGVVQRNFRLAGSVGFAPDKRTPAK